MNETAKKCIQSGRCVIGIELGSTRIKSVLINEAHEPIASGSYDWENRLENGVWTYSLEDIHNGLQDSYADLAKNVWEQYGEELTEVAAIGISGMMHGYMVFNDKNELMVPFRTWRNTITGEAAQKLSELFSFNIPQRWSVAHLYQSILNGEEHVADITYLSTLACYIHWLLTGQKVAGVGEASGMFPIDSATLDYDTAKMEQFDALIADKGYSWKLADILPKVLTAGQDAGVLTKEGAAFLDVSGKLKAGIPLCPPEGDAGTGMVATNAVAVRTGNVSAGTSVFSMVVLEKPLSAHHEELDMVTTPSGEAVAMVHCNNCTSDLNAWVNLFGEFAACLGADVDKNTLFGLLYNKALEGDKDCGGLMAYNYFSGEHITGFNEGRPLFMRCPDSKFTLANFMRTHLYTCLGALKTGMDILQKQEKVQVDCITGHGGLFKTKGVGQKVLAAAINAPVSVMETAGEGGAWGVALLAAYMVWKAENETLAEYLNSKVFASMQSETIQPDAADAAGYDAFIEQYKKCLPVEHAAVENFKF